MKEIHPRKHARKRIRWKLLLWGLCLTAIAMLLAHFTTPHIALLLFPERAAENPEMLQQIRFIATLIYFTLLGILFMLFGQENIINRILVLSSAAQQIASGNFDIQIASTERRDEVYQLTQDFNLMARELKQNEYLRKDFISNVSHELKTPLIVMKGYADLLASPDAETIPAETRQGYAEIIHHESERLLNLTTNMLYISRLDNQRIPSSRNRFCLDEQIRQVVLFLEPKWTAAQIELDLDLDSCTYFGNEELLEQVWVNLLDNAIKFSQYGSQIHLTLRRKADEICVSIQDEGEGMSKNTQERIFEQFYQGESSHAKEGNGLGLPIVLRIIQLHEGKIQVDSVLHEGTCITVSLPLKKQTKMTDRQA